jgi:hypothetical protein
MKASGSELRDAIAALLRIHHSKVDTEIKVGATTADVLYVDDTQPIFPRKIAIESKDWAKPLTSSQIASIYNLYRPAIGNDIDFLWIVGRHVLSGQPKSTIQKLDKVVYSTFDEFQSNLINLQPVISHNISSFTSDEAFKEFVETRSKDSDEPLFDLVQRWLKGSKIGLVVYGGYGLGKTTFSKYLASRLSIDHMTNSSGRIPVRFSLGDIYHKQDIGSLISSSLAAAEGGVQIRNFTLSLFMEMNRLGKLLLIFDGFDEMRHAIDLEDFVFNFSQLRSLMVENAKLVILGRPDGFLSSMEELKVLSALFDDPSATSELLDLVEVSFFTPQEVGAYLDNFMRGRSFSEERRQQVSNLVNNLPDDDHDNILSRPVQLKMFTVVLDDITLDGKTPSRYELYQSFIYRFIIREQAKKARILKSDSEKLGRDARALFMQNAAWWLLNIKKENRFTAAEFPRDLIPFDIRQRHGDEAAVREALLGSVIEPMDQSGVLGKKGGRYYYFPHKSYIEFLVAQYYSYSEFSPAMHRTFMENVTKEVVSFVEEGPVGGLENLRKGMDYLAGRTPRYVVEAAARAPSVSEEIGAPGTEKASSGKLYTYYLHLSRIGNATEFLRKQLTVPAVPGRMLALVNCVGDSLKQSGDKALARTLVVNFLTSIFDDHHLRGYLRDQSVVHLFRDDEIAVKAGALLSALELSAASITLFPDRLMDFSLAASTTATSVELAAKGRHRAIELSMADLLPLGGVAADNAGAVLTGLIGKATSFNDMLLPVVLRGEAERYSMSRSP